MEINILRFPSEFDWIRAYNLARTTRNIEEVDFVPEEWKKKILKAEHSPIRTLMYTIEMKDIPYYVSVHFCRHKFGVEHYVSSQRSNPNRSEEKQGALVTHIMDLNAQSLISIANKRLCNKADPVTQEVMEEIKKQLINLDDPIVDFLNPDCEKYGICNEFFPCGKMEKK